MCPCSPPTPPCPLALPSRCGRANVKRGGAWGCSAPPQTSPGGGIALAALAPHCTCGSSCSLLESRPSPSQTGFAAESEHSLGAQAGVAAACKYADEDVLVIVACHSSAVAAPCYEGNKTSLSVPWCCFSGTRTDVRICIDLHHQSSHPKKKKKRGEAKSWRMGCGKGSLGLERGCCKSEGLRPRVGYCRALCSQNIDSVNTVQHHGGFPAARPCLLLAGGQGRGGRGRRSVQGEAATVIWGWAGTGDGAEDLEKGNGSYLKEGKGRSWGGKAAGSPWGWSSPARGG